MSRFLSCLALSLVVACTATTPVPLRTIDPGLMVGKSSEPATFERRNDAPFDEPEPDRRQKARTGTFWAGVALATIGAAGTIGFAAAGQAFEHKLARGYETSLSRPRAERYRTRGELMNGMAIGSSAAALVGLLLAAVSFGIDYTVCGKLSARLRDCPRQDP